jgi:hypothetical protein
MGEIADTMRSALRELPRPIPGSIAAWRKSWAMAPPPSRNPAP